VLQWFQMNLEKGVVHIDAQINDFDGPLQFPPTKRELHPKVRERLREKTLETPNTPSLDLDQRVEPTQLTQVTPTKERNTSKKRKPHIWSRSKFSEHCKVDYINNNLSESFNSWVSKIKDMHIVQMLDKIRQMIIEKLELRHKIGNNMKGKIIPIITKSLNAQSKNIKDHEVLMFGNGIAEVTVAAIEHVVNLGEKTCSCRAWQVCENPCTHALTTIAKVSGEVNMEDFVHDYFYVEKFRKEYEGTFKPMTS
jgi:hypothetical protein